MNRRFPTNAPLPRIKVCGVTRDADLDMLARCGVDAVGLNLVPSSPRYLVEGRASELAAQAGRLRLTRVAVVMNADCEQLRQLICGGEFDFVQLHGEETPQALDGLELNDLAENYPGLIKAISWSNRSEELALAGDWQRFYFSPPIRGPRLQAFLVDAYAPGQGGGSGKLARWDLLFPRPPMLEKVPLLLAGGLTPDNVAQAIALTLPAGVDTASGVELTPGAKSSERTLQFASQAKLAFEQAATTVQKSSTFF